MIKIMTDIKGGTFWLQFPYNPKLITAVKTMDGRKWHPEFKMWHLPATPAQASTIDRTLRQYQYTADEPFHKMLAQHNRGVDTLNAEPTYRETATPCFHHQLIGLDMGINRNAIYLAWEMGTGKSKTVVDIAGVLRLKRILIICPRKVVPVWPRQFIEHGHGYGIRCIALKKKSVTYRTRVAQKALSMGPTAVVINYEACWLQPFGKWALNQCWDLIACDEAHRIKGNKSRVSKFMHKLADHTSRRVCLSGTPIPNNPLDLWSQCMFLDPGLFGSSFIAFKSRYCVMGGYQDKQVLGFRNLDDMNRRFYELAHRVTKEEALDLPEETDVSYEVELEKDGVRHYEKMEGAFVAQVEEGTITIANVLVESLRLQQCTGGAVKYDGDDDITEIDTAKADMIEDRISDLPTSEPVVIFCRFHHDIDAVHRMGDGRLDHRRADPGRRSGHRPHQILLLLLLLAGIVAGRL
jgi:hypothetical protein